VWQGDADDQDDVDLSSTVYNMIDTILKFLHIDKYTHVVKRNGRSRDFLVDIYPEVYSGLEGGEVKRLLGAHEFSPDERRRSPVTCHSMDRATCRDQRHFHRPAQHVHAGESGPLREPGPQG